MKDKILKAYKTIMIGKTMMIHIYINRIFHSLIIISLTNKIKHNIINRCNINIKILCKQYKINKNPSLYNH